MRAHLFECPFAEKEAHPPQEARRRQSRHGEAFARTALPRVQLEPPRRPDLPEGYAPSAYSDEAVVDELSSTT